MHAILSARSSFSIGESILTVERLVDQAKAVGATAIALTDTMSVTGMIDFTKRCKSAEVKPIIGCRLRLVDDVAARKVKGEKWRQAEYFLTWYSLSERGQGALFKLLSLANDADHFYMTSKLSFDDLFATLATLCADDVALATSDAYSVFHHKQASLILDKIKATLSARSVFLSLTPIDTPLFDTLNKRAIDYGGADGQYLVAYPTSYGERQAEPAMVMGAIVKPGTKIADPWCNIPAHDDAHPMHARDLAAKSVAAIGRLAARGLDKATVTACFKQGLGNQDRLVAMVGYEWSKAAPCLPVMAAHEFAVVSRLCMEGWRRRFERPIFGHKPTKAELDEAYKPRLAYELGVLKRLDFSSYFLLVHDIVQFAKGAGIMVGPGRGSVGGSLVAYLMGITECDPLRFGLLFERFINPDRIDLPDADLDFMSARRGEIIDYLIGKYGIERVAGVSNFSTLGAASAIRDVSRAAGLSDIDYRCSTLAPNEHGMRVELERSAKMVADIGAFRDKYPPIWRTCLALEGVLRTLGQHAAGIVVGGCDLVERAVVERRGGSAGVVCWDKRIVEDQGLIKVDVLGLSTLDLLDLALRYIKERHDLDIDLMAIRLDDKPVLDKFAAADTTGVFQFDGGGMRRLLRELGRDGTITYDDITAATALYRPGPMDSGMMDSYWRRKQGIEFVEVDHPAMKDIVEPTFGVLVYQEQVMQTAVNVCGYSLPEADKLRKIMGKKEPAEMAKQKGKFVGGAVSHGKMDETKATELFEKIAKFAAYGFNKSHSVEYSLISYQAMWLKTYYPVEFFAAALTLMPEDKLPAVLRNATQAGIDVLLPDANASTWRFEILSDTRLAIPFNRVKGLSETTAREIVRARGATPFVDMADFTGRVSKSKCNAGKVGALEKVGAFAAITPGAVPQRDSSRIKDQVELLPGLITDVVPVHRVMNTDKHHRELLEEAWDRFDRDNPGLGFVRPKVGRKPRFMFITDAPSKGEVEERRATESRSFKPITEALTEVGLSIGDGYWTTLLKTAKGGSRITPNEIKLYLPLLQREMEILKPPLIIAAGSTIVRQFLPDFKGMVSAEAGKVHYLKALDINLVIGFSPGEIYHAPEKQAAMNAVLAVVASIIS